MHSHAFGYRWPLQLAFLATVGCLLWTPAGLPPARIAQAQPPAAEQPPARAGWRVEVPLPITQPAAAAIIEQLTAIAEGADALQGGRRVVVLDYQAADNDGSATRFEDALQLARAFGKADFRSLRLVGFVDAAVRGHAVLPLLACDALAIGPSASIGHAVVGEGGADADDTVMLSYQAIAARRGVFPAAVATALVRPSVELVQATTLDGKRQFVSGEELNELRRSGGGWKEEVWAAAGAPLVLTAARLRDARIAAYSVASMQQLVPELELSELKTVSEQMLTADALAVLLNVSGVVSPDRVRRWELNLVHAAEAGAANLWMVSVESPGGSLGGSVQLAGTLSTTQPPIRRSVGYVGQKALADSALVALACRPLYLHPDARLGGPGAATIRSGDVMELEAAIERIALDAGRPSALLRGLLDPSLDVYRYTNRRTGEIRYETADMLDAVEANPAERGQWQRGEAIPLAEGLSAAQAIELGLAEGQAESLQEVARQIGLTEVPAALAPRGIIHFVEWFGSQSGVAVFLLLIGLLTLSIEIGAPGLSLPGFISMLCFTLYFWIQFLSGTAEWLEILAFVLGVVCIGIELFILPGTGVFGIGGLCLLILGVVLTSQTFVIPRNAYQYEQMTRNLWLVLASIGAVTLGLVVLKVFLPRTRLMRDLALEVPDDQLLDRSERLANFEHLLGQLGIASTPLMPAGKVKFGEEYVQVVTDGSPVAVGDPVRVIQVLGNRVVVAPLD